VARGLLLGIDLGTTVVKAVVFDARTGALAGRASRRIPVMVRKGDRREQRPAALDNSLGGALHKLRADLGASWQKISGVGIASQGGSTIIADRASGRPLIPMILWNDARHSSLSDKIAGLFPDAFWRRFALRDAMPDGLARLAWLQEHDPGLFAPENIHIGAGEYLLHQCTGVWRQDAGNAIQIGTYNAARATLDPAALGRLGLSLDFVAPLRDGHETYPLSRQGAKRLGLPEGIPVAGPYIDQEAGYLAAAAAGEGPLQLSLGTAWVGNFMLPRDNRGWSPFQLVLAPATGTGRLVVLPLLTGNAGWDWALARFADASRDDSFAAAARVFAKRLLPPPGMGAIPWFAQPNPLVAGTFGGGCFWGIGPDTPPEDLLRAVAAGMAFEAARVFGQLRDSGAVQSVVLTGGGRNAPYLRALLAALFAPLPVLCESDDDLAVSRGAVSAFGGAAGRCRLRAVPLPRQPEPGRIADAIREHEAVYGKLCGEVANGRPYRVEKRKK
jgi:sugar (pentulose or hexulose) kinase